MEGNIETVYVCEVCNGVLDEATMLSHPCLHSSATDVDKEDDPQSAEYQLEKDEPNPEADDFAVNYAATRKKLPGRARPGEWAEEDVRRLIAVYIKHYKDLPEQERLHNHYLWDRVMRDLKPYGDFSRFLVQVKIKKLKKACKALIDSGSNDTKWPYFDEMCSVLRMEEDTSKEVAGVTDNVVKTEPEHPATPEEEDEGTDSDNGGNDNDSQSNGLCRWTIKETRHLIQVYRKHLPGFYKNGNRRKICWESIIADLGYDLAKRFTMYQIRAKIRNVQSTYRSIIGKKRKKPSTHWPLFRDVAALAKDERELSLDGAAVISFDETMEDMMVSEAIEQQNEENSDDEKAPGIRWNVEETQELLNAYKANIFDLYFLASPEKKEEVWKQIAAEVNTIRRRKIKPAQAAAKIDLLRSLFLKGDEKSLAPLYNEVSEMVQVQTTMEASQADEPDSDTLVTPMAREPAHDNGSVVAASRQQKRALIRSRSASPARKMHVSRDDVPPWFTQYSADAARRHQEKLRIQQNIINVLENILLHS